MADGGGTGVNIGNYKGVMLCNRPFNGVSAAVKSSNLNKSSRVPFVIGSSSSAIGQNVPIFAEPPHAAKRDKTKSALSKHKKWLHDLAQERERLEAALLEETNRKNEQRKRFSEREAAVRARIREQANQGDKENSSNQIQNENENNTTSKKKTKKGVPMWALTEEDATQRVEEEEEEDVDHLVQFAEDLDIDNFMDKVEMKNTVDQINKRYAELQAEVDEEELELKRLELRAESKESAGNGLNVNLLNAHNRNHNYGDDKKEMDDDLQSITSTVLSECKSIRSVHSTRSMAMLTKKSMEKQGALASISEMDNSPIAAPKVITHDEEEGSRMLIKKNPSNLPYIHRNPAL